MTGRHRRTLERIFTLPTPVNIRWNEVESLMRALGAEIIQGSGSRVRFIIDGRRVAVHRPHPRSEVGRADIRDIREFLIRIGVRP